MSEELQTQPEQPQKKKLSEKTVNFLADILRGAMMGIAFIIPGFSGGSVAAILGIYEKLVGAIADIFKHFKRSFLTLLPFAIGLVLGVVALMFPLRIALEYFPIPTVCLFVGLAIGGIPSITDKVSGKPKPLNFLSFLIPCACAVALSFLPVAGDVDLFDLSFGGYLLLFVIGLLCSSALVVPGISGSMLLLILGYYNPLLKMITDNLMRFQNVGTSIAVLGVTALGIAIGFFFISVLMKWLFQKCPRGTYFAILGFIIGSIPTVFISTAKDAGLTFATLPTSPWYWIVSVLLLAIGFTCSFLFVLYARKKEKAKQQAEEQPSQE